MKKSRIAVLGSMHMDLIARAEHLPAAGHSTIGHSFTMAPGGKGGNQAAQVALMGGDVFMIAALGDDLFGRALLDALRAKGVHTDHIAITRDHATGASTVLSADDGYSSIIYPGAAAELKLSNIDAALLALGQLDYLILQLELPLPIVLYAAKVAHERGVKVVLNYSPAPKTPFDVLLQYVSIIVVNEHEAEALSKMPHGIDTVIVTSGGKGSHAVQQGVNFQQAAFPAKVLDTVGAGDSFLGTVVALLAEGGDMQLALRHGAAAGALAVGRAGAFTALPTRAEITAFLQAQSSF